MLESSAALIQCALSCGLSLECTPPEGGIFIYGDKRKLRQIAINLLSNAIKFTPTGGAISFTAALDARGLNLKIADTGIGMSADDIRHAVEPFRQVDNGFSRRFEGTGLGLPLAIQFTERHGGRLSIESTPGSGTAVAVWFPVNRISRGRPSNAAWPGQTIQTGFEGKKRAANS
jgi:signal transduction histidine kinase